MTYLTLAITYIKASLVIFMLVVMWGTLIFNEWVSMIMAWVFDRTDAKVRVKRDPSTGWLHSKLLAQDIMVNVNCGGYFRTTISSELGNLKLQGSETGTIVADVVDLFFIKLFNQYNHCIGAIEPNDRFIFNPFRMVLGFTLFVTVNALKYIVFYMVLSEWIWLLM